MNVFEHMVDSLGPKIVDKVSREEFDEFEYQMVLYVLKDIPYGRAFCEHFGIPEMGHRVIWNLTDTDRARKWILDNYIL